MADEFPISSQFDPSMSEKRPHPGGHLEVLRAEAVRADGVDDRPRTYVQWQGSTLCVDFDCPCGHGAHLDEGFLFAVRCPACGRRWELVPQLLVRLVPDGEEIEHDCVVDLREN